MSVARSACIDHDALCDSLESGKIAHAVLDSPPEVSQLGHCEERDDATSYLQLNTFLHPTLPYPSLRMATACGTSMANGVQ